MTEQTKNKTKKPTAVGTIKEKDDPYIAYYKGKGVGQDKPAKSMPKLSAFLRKNEATKILDFSCGTGRNLIFMAREGFDAHGFDFSEYAVKACRQELRREGLRAEVRLCNAEAGLPYRSGSFDAVMIVRAMYQAKMETIRRLAEEVDRVTRKGGYVYLESYQNLLCFRRKDMRVEKIEQGTYKFLEQWHQQVYHFFTKKELKQLFEGYRTVRFYFKSRRYYILLQKPY